MTFLDPNKNRDDITPSQAQIQEKDVSNPKNCQNKNWWQYLVEMLAVISTILKILEIFGFEL